MLRQFFHDSIIYGLSSVLSRGISFFLLPIYARTLSPTEYGILDYISVISSFITVFVALEISQGVARFASDTLNNQKELQEYASTSLIFTVWSYTILFLIFFFNREELSVLLFGKEFYSDLVVLAATSYCISGVLYLVQGQLRWELKPKKHAIVSIIMSLLTAALSILFIVILELSVEGALWATIIAGAVSISVAMFYARASYGLTFKTKKLIDMLSFSSPLVISSLSAIGAIYIDRVFIKEIVGLEELGYYGIAWRISLVITLAMMGVQGALTPLVYSHHKEAEAPANIEKIFRYFIALALALYLIICIFLPYYFSFLVGTNYMSAIPVIPVLCLAVLFSGMYIFAPGLGIEKKTKQITLVNLGGLAINIALNLILVPLYGAIGAATSTLISAVFIFSILLYLSQKYYPVPHKWNVIFPTFLLTIIITYAVTYLPSETFFDFGLRFIIFGSTLAAFLKLGLISSQEIKDFSSFMTSLTRRHSGA